LGIAALVLHLLAIYSPHWKTIKRDREPVMTPVSYGLWQRCEYDNLPIMKQGVALGTRANVEICYPNRYMRYSPNNYQTCYNVRRQCPVLEKSQLPEGCLCRYLPSTKGLQWLTVLAAICLICGLLIIYLKIITSSNNSKAEFVLNYGPLICFLLTLVLMVTGLILFGAYLRRDTYEDYSFPLQSVVNSSHTLQGFELHSLRSYAKLHEATFSRESYKVAENELRTDANTHYHTVIGRAAIYEIIATLFILIVTVLTFLFGTSTRADDV